MNMSYINNSLSMMQSATAQCNDISFSCKKACIEQCTNKLMTDAINSYFMFLVLACVAFIIFALLYSFKDSILPKYNSFGVIVLEKEYMNILYWIFLIGFVLLIAFMIVVKYSLKIF